MPKRKADDLYCFVLPAPKWPRVDEPEKWTDHDLESAAMIHSLQLDAAFQRHFGHFTGCHLSHHIQGPRQPLNCKVSPCIRALDLAHIDDYDFFDVVVTRPDGRSPQHVCRSHRTGRTWFEEPGLRECDSLCLLGMTWPLGRPMAASAGPDLATVSEHSKKL